MAGAGPSRAEDGAAARPADVCALRGRETRRETRRLLVEAPLAIEVNDVPPIIVMRTPGRDRELAVGFLFTEGAIRGIGDIGALAECPETADAIRVTLAAGAPVECLRRATASVSSCGLCGRESLDATLARLRPVPDGPPVPLEMLYRMPALMRGAQPLFEATGAAHAAAAFDLSGALVALREDVGRHNALDKLVGWALLSGRALHEMVLMLSGRLSVEIVLKAAAAGVPAVASVSAPTSLGVDLAERLNITLCGFCRGAEGTVYAHPERLVG